METVAKNAEGNPFYLEELVKVLIEDGVIVKGEELWQIVPHSATQLRVPATLTGVLQARLDRLPSAESEVLRTRRGDRPAHFGMRLSQQYTAQKPPRSSQAGEEVRSALNALVRKELVFSHQPSAFASTQEFIFSVRICREVTYERVLKAKRKLYHRMAADWLILQSDERIEMNIWA